MPRTVLEVYGLVGKHKYGIKALTEVLTWYRRSSKRMLHSLWGLGDIRNQEAFLEELTS